MSESLADLRRSVPPGRPEEYAVTQFARNKRGPRWMNDVVGEVIGIGFGRFPEPPFSARWTFGESDRPWLERVRAAYRAALQERAEAMDYRDLVTASETDPLAEHYRNDVRPPFRRLLQEVAHERFEASPELQARFFDPRPLAEMTVGSPEYYWLKEVLRSNWPHPVYVVGLIDSEDRRYLAATDVPELVRISMEIQKAIRKWDVSVASREEGLLTTKEESIRLMRPFAERLFAFVNARKPGGG